MINMKISNDELLANATHATMHLVDHSGIYVLDELTELAGSSRSAVLPHTTSISLFPLMLLSRMSFAMLL